MNTCYLPWLFIILCYFFGEFYAQFQGGTANWRVIRGQVRITYRVTWERDRGPCGLGCGISDLKKKTNIGKPYSDTYWKCTNGCPTNTTGGNLNYVVTAVSEDPGWEQGENVFTYNPTGSNILTFVLNGINWTKTSNESVPLPVGMETIVDTRKRNDTNVPNASPLAALPPYISIPHGCFSKISLPVKDPDEDLLKCRFALPSKCGTACTNLPDAYLDKSSCMIAVNATSERGYLADDVFRVVVVIEDFPSYAVQLGTEVRMPSQSLSKIPLQFTIRILNSTNCDNRNSFVLPTLNDNQRVPFVQINRKIVSAFYLQTPDVNETDFLVSAPAGTRYDILPDDMGRTNITRIYLTWNTGFSQAGDNLICVWGIEPNGLVTSKRCIDAMILDIDDCARSPCHKGGTCVDLFHRSICKCPPGLKPPYCDQNVSCADDPCINNGTCVNSTPYNCNCRPGFTGDNCEAEINQCMSFPCFNGGKCNQKLGGFDCSCPQGYNGSQCQIDTNPCARNPCYGLAMCKQNYSDFVCICPIGLTGKLCDTNIDECTSVTCNNGGTCIDNFGSYTCACTTGWKESNCHKDINECIVNNICRHGNCHNTPGSYHCICNVGWTGYNCDINIDDCALSPCMNGGTCLDFVDGYTCQCSPGWIGRICDTPSHIDQCSKTPCKHGSTCIDIGLHFTCICVHGWMGVDCSKDIDECKTANICNHGICHNFPGSYNCTCDLGWEGPRCDINIDECVSSPCLNGGTCLDHIVGYTCQCMSGWGGTKCSNTLNSDHCSQKPCLHGSSCINLGKNYTCVCSPGWRGQNCSTDINECKITNICNHGICSNTPGSYRCVCNKGWTGYVCDSNIDDCTSFPCLNGGTCLDQIGTYKCQCAHGWVGITCDTQIQINNHCLNNPCKHNSICINTSSNFSCRCSDGFTGTTCSENINECVSGNSICKHGATCRDTIGSYNCACTPGWEGLRCDTNINECINAPCRKTEQCVDTLGSYKCVCNRGYTGIFCNQTINYCHGDSCGSNGNCSNTKSGFICTCDQGFTGDKCDTSVSRSQQNAKSCGKSTGNCTESQGQQQSNITISLNNPDLPTPWIILSSSLAGLLLLAILCGCYFCLRGTCCGSSPITDRKDDEKWAQKRESSENMKRSDNNPVSDTNRRPKPQQKSARTSIKPQSVWNDSSRTLSSSYSYEDSLRTQSTAFSVSGQPNTQSRISNIYLSSKHDPLFHKVGRI